MKKKKPIFKSQREFTEAARAAGVTPETCVWVASTKLVDPMWSLGINNSTEEAVREAFAELGNNPTLVEITPADPDKFNNAAKVVCDLCGQCTIFVGPIDAQRALTPDNPENRTCPIWSTVQA